MLEKYNACHTISNDLATPLKHWPCLRKQIGAGKAKGVDEL